MYFLHMPRKRKVREHVEKSEPSYIAARTLKLRSIVENTLIILQYWTQNYHKTCQFHSNAFKQILHTCYHNSSIHNMQKVGGTQMSMNRWNKMQKIHTVEYNLTIGKNKLLIHATVWIYLNDILLSESSQTQKTMLMESCYMILFI